MRRRRGVALRVDAPRQNVHARVLSREEDGQVSDEAEDALAVLRDQIRPRRCEDERLQARALEHDLVQPTENDGQGGVARHDLQRGLEDGDEGREQAEGEEEVPVDAVLGDVLGVVQPLDAEQTDDAQDEQGQGVAHRGGQARGQRRRAALGALLEDGTGGDDAGAVDEGADAHIHQGRAPGLDLGEAAGEEAEVDGEDGDAGDDHHAPAVMRQKRLDGESRERALGSSFGLCIGRDDGLLATGVWREGVDDNGRGEQEEVE